MNENLDLTKILDGCPKGTKLYSTIYGEVIFAGITNSGRFPVELIYYTIDKFAATTFATKDGQVEYNCNGECTLFPSKEQRDWLKFERFWDNPKTKKFENYNPKENSRKIEYNIWHIDAYTGYNDFHRNTYFPTPLNHHIDIIANATLTKWDIYNMFYEKHSGSRVKVIDKCFIVDSGVVTYGDKESLK